MKIKNIKLAVLSAALALGAGVVFAQEADPSPNTIAYWKMNQWSTNIPVGSGLTHGIADLATNVGQGTLSGGATAPASVGVKMPERMPPRMMAIVTMPQMASTAILSAWRNGTTSPFG